VVPFASLHPSSSQLHYSPKMPHPENWNIIAPVTDGSITKIQGFRYTKYAIVEKEIMETTITKMTLDEVKDAYPDLFGPYPQYYKCGTNFSLCFVNSAECYVIAIEISQYDGLLFDYELLARNKNPRAEEIKAQNDTINKKYDTWSTQPHVPLIDFQRNLLQAADGLPKMVLLQWYAYLKACQL
jgi:hypothetical protein